MDPVFVSGVIALLISAIVFFGSVWLLTGLILGARLGYLVTAASLAGIMVVLSGMWFMNKLGPVAPETNWHALSAGPRLVEATYEDGTTYDLSDYPDGDWQVPQEGAYLADLHPKLSPCLALITDCENRDTAGEVENVSPVMDALISSAVSSISANREKVADQIEGTINLSSGEFALADIRFKETEVEGKLSIIAAGRAVPSAQVAPASYGEGIEEAELVEYLIQPGEEVENGQPLILASAEGTEIEVASDQQGTLISLGFRPGDLVRPGSPLGVLEVSGQPGVPDPVQVTALRVIGSPRSTARTYLIVSIVMFVLHMALLRRYELSRRVVTPTETA